MKEEVESFYEYLKDFHSAVLRISSKTISTREFKQKIIDIYDSWKTDMQYALRAYEIENDVVSSLDKLFDAVYKEANMRVANVANLRAKIGEINDIFWKQVVVTLRKEKKTSNLMESASFLGLDTNWSLATCALQLQEVAVTLVAKRKGIFLDKEHVEEVLDKKIKDIFFFNDKYEVFGRQVKSAFGVEMPKLTKYLRRMRVDVLHGGYNPKPEETESIVSFTIGLLKKLKNL